jgi:hypothetical protein
MSSININEENDEYWIPKLKKNPYKEMHIVGSSTCSTEE